MFAILRGAAVARALSTAVLALGLSALTGCANFYVDNKLPEVPAAQFVKPAEPRAVQLFFEFQSKGVPNQQATALLKTRITDQIRGSGVFSAVTEAPAPGGATLSIVLDNVPTSDDAFSKGFVTGLTFGLAGSQVGDGYLCTATYRAPGAAEPIVKKTRQVLWTTIGAKGAPPDATKASSIDEAITLISRQVVSNVLNDVTHDPSFR
ncbi:hypothetical protein [Roseateles sp.]|uniref:hypothetical protein n=1 Tax=Roseateles sp. TaxID=1971397 RepID=UPI0031DF4D3E